MPRKLVKTNSFNAVASGATATLDLPVGERVYHQLRLIYTTTTAGGATQANMESEIVAIRLKIDGKVQRLMSAKEAFSVAAFNGIAFQTGQLPIFFSEPWRRSVQGEDALAWGTADVSTFQVEVDLLAGAYTPTLTARVSVERVARPLGPIVKWRRFRVPVSAVGIVNVTTLPKSDAYYRMHAFSANVVSVAVKVDQEDFHEATQAINDAYLKGQGFTPQASTYHIVFDPTNRVSDALAMRVGDRTVAEFRVDFDMSVAAAFDLLTEVLGTRD